MQTLRPSKAGDTHPNRPPLGGFLVFFDSKSRQSPFPAFPAGERLGVPVGSFLQFVEATKPLFARDELEDSPSLKTIKQLFVRTVVLVLSATVLVLEKGCDGRTNFRS